ncbi:venom allergen-1 [Drosophila virilis]|uniref:SCP domain-containing protein n=1 Tax=Drosophila virilis TaxID=7244 RepID=B4MEP1_DROVI|nr:antigen 5 like allergen Cul n 1 [Drosophila virilis]EDW63016.1 uncharacterized protein Dvir_GJ14736 [Drosophila virilis]
METARTKGSSNWLMIQAIAMLGLLTAGSLATDYCQIESCSGEKHIACGNDGSFANSCPAGAKLLAVDNAAQKAVVVAHNDLRQQWASGQGRVRVSACQMATISWDPELARLAELNVKQCQMEHDDCHNTKIYKNSGQNLYIVGTTGSGESDAADILRNAVADWATEAEHINADQLAEYPDNYNGPTIGHFTVMVNERNVAVGCAISNYLDDGFNTYLVACNYAATNFIGSPIYKSCSQPAESCKSGTNPKNSALCSSSEDVDYNFDDPSA